MLTDKEKKALIDRHSFGLDINPYHLIDAVERAVLAMPIPKQEPVGSVKKWIDSNTAIVSGERMAEIYGEEKLYSSPQPAQAAAIPESELFEKLQARIRHLERLLLGL